MTIIELLLLLTQDRVMVVKKKTAKVEAVVLDEENLHRLIGNGAPDDEHERPVQVCVPYIICVIVPNVQQCVIFLSFPLCGWRRGWGQAGCSDPAVLFGADGAGAADPAG